MRVHVLHDSLVWAFRWKVVTEKQTEVYPSARAMPCSTPPTSSPSCSVLLFLSSRCLTTFTISAQWKTQHTSRICCLRHQFNLKTFSATPSTQPNGNPIPHSHWGRHHWRLLFVASSVFYCSALWANTKIVAARARWIELFCIVWTNPSTSGWLRGYENMIGAGAGGDTAV